MILAGVSSGSVLIDWTLSPFQVMLSCFFTYMSHLFDWIRHFLISPNIPEHSFGVWFGYGNSLILSYFYLRLVMRIRAVSNVELIDSH